MSLNPFHENPGNDKQKLCDDITQLTSALERTLQQIFEGAGDRIKPEAQAKLWQEMTHTKQLLERLRTRYENEVDSSNTASPSGLALVSTPQCTTSTAPSLL